MLVFEHQLMRFGDAVEAERAPQNGPDLTALDQLVGLRALVRVGEVLPEYLLLAHPQIGDVEVEVDAGRARADDDFSKRLGREHRCRKGGFADVLEDDVRRVAEDLLDALGRSEERRVGKGCSWW